MTSRCFPPREIAVDGALWRPAGVDHRLMPAPDKPPRRKRSSVARTSFVLGEISPAARFVLPTVHLEVISGCLP